VWGSATCRPIWETNSGLNWEDGRRYAEGLASPFIDTATSAFLLATDAAVRASVAQQIQSLRPSDIPNILIESITDPFRTLYQGFVCDDSYVLGKGVGGVGIEIVSAAAGSTAVSAGRRTVGGAERVFQPRFQSSINQFRRYKGEPVAFGTGSRQARAEAIVSEAAKAFGVSPQKYIDVVRYERGSSYFEVDALGQRVVTIGSRAFRRNRTGQILEAAHELVHAQQFHRLLHRYGGNIQDAWDEFSSYPFGSMQYALDEVVAERVALQRVERYLGSLPPQQRAVATRYIQSWRTIFQAGGAP
jgi:hypothetical protein